MIKDKNTIGLTSNGKTFMETLLKLGWFKLDMDAAKFALAFAISKKVVPGEAKGAGTVWNIGTIDSDGAIATILFEFYNEKNTPYKLAEYLIDEGLKLIIERLQKNPELTLTELADS